MTLEQLITRQNECRIHDSGDEHRDATSATALLLSPLLTQRVTRDDEFSRGWNAACAAMRSLLERP